MSWLVLFLGAQSRDWSRLFLWWMASFCPDWGVVVGWRSLRCSEYVLYWFMSCRLIWDNSPPLHRHTPECRVMLLWELLVFVNSYISQLYLNRENVFIYSSVLSLDNQTFWNPTYLVVQRTAGKFTRGNKSSMSRYESLWHISCGSWNSSVWFSNVLLFKNLGQQYRP